MHAVQDIAKGAVDLGDKKERKEKLNNREAHDNEIQYIQATTPGRSPSLDGG